MLHFNDTKACFAAHMGEWLMEPKSGNALLSAIKAGILDREVNNDPYELRVIGNIAHISISGAMMKGASKFGGTTSTVKTRQLIREAKASQDIAGVFLEIESGGGTVAGTKELADDLDSLAAIKPVHAYINDVGASAAYWVASKANKISMNEMGQAGSIGVVAVVEDTSGAYERQGVKVHVISTGPLKGAFTEGAEVTDTMIAEMQERVDDINEVFLSEVVIGRGMDIDDLREIADGRMYNAKQSIELGLVDAIETREEAFASLQARIKLNSSRQSLNARLSQSARR